VHTAGFVVLMAKYEAWPLVHTSSTNKNISLSVFNFCFGCITDSFVCNLML